MPFAIVEKDPKRPCEKDPGGTPLQWDCLTSLPNLSRHKPLTFPYCQPCQGGCDLHHGHLVWSFPCQGLLLGQTVNTGGAPAVLEHVPALWPPVPVHWAVHWAKLERQVTPTRLVKLSGRKFGLGFRYNLFGVRVYGIAGIIPCLSSKSGQYHPYLWLGAASQQCS